MIRIVDNRSIRVLVNPHAVAERLSVWSEEARRAGRFQRAEQLLLAAWEAFDIPCVEHAARAFPFGRTNQILPKWLEQAV